MPWGHDYVTIVIDAEPTREKGTVTAFAQKLERHSGFKDGIAENFPNAECVIDKFHVKQVLINALNTVGDRRLFMIPKSRMTEQQADKLAELSKTYPKTGRAYRIIAALNDMYACRTIDEVVLAFARLYS